MNKFGKTEINPWLILVGVVVLALFMGWIKLPQGTAPATGGLGGVPTSGGGTTTINIPPDTVTVTWSSWDAYSTSTSAGTNHRVLDVGGKLNFVEADDATETPAPGSAYRILLGQQTENIGNGSTNYYPTYKTGTIGNKGAETIAGGQYLSDRAPTFTFFNENAQVSTGQAVGSGGTATVAIRLQAGNQKCFGNKDVSDGNNILCTRYNTSAWKSPALKLNGAELTSATKPNSIVMQTWESSKCYQIPIFCNNAKLDYDVYLEAKTSSTDPNNTISVTLSDVSWDFDADTLAILPVGVEDEDSNDIGVPDVAAQSANLTMLLNVY